MAAANEKQDMRATRHMSCQAPHLPGQSNSLVAFDGDTDRSQVPWKLP